ncbi:histidine-containing phosphotransfer protein 5-like [Ipomoea triloba]|uniref:histidine-containing phosphotransfer protein 5-like n=1 Tax=Ipomoea triloba TaxID=35885 RepID=UPI00125CF8CE|nr:histidine-containing phosphotransfer protein 5-like [Ipomoea triloba]XP_031093665.1 histidine-containing phosphotransfer protein 5-like [Ipomoea triloba]
MADEHAQQIANLRQSFDQQLLNEKFIRTEEIDVGLPGFQEDFYCTYFREAERLVGILKLELHGPPFDVESIEMYLHEFRSNTKSAGAVKVLTKIDRCIECCSVLDFAGCLACLEEANTEMKYLKRQIKNYFMAWNLVQKC